MKPSLKSQIFFLAILINLIFANAVSANLVTNPGFETYEPTHIFGFPGLPGSFGDWGGDLSEIVTSENGITPFDIRMLRFDATGNEANPSLNSCEVYQWIDLSAYEAAIATGDSTAVLSAYFNRVLGDDETDTSMSVRIYANTGTPTFTTNDYISALRTLTGTILTDGDVDTWEQATAEIVLPADTTYLVIRLSAYENIFVDGEDPEFDGHYADNVSLTIEKPSTSIPTLNEWGLIFMSLFLAGSAFWMIRQRQVS